MMKSSTSMCSRWWWPWRNGSSRRARRRAPVAVGGEHADQGALEDALGKPLFIRDTRNVTPTDDGTMLAEYGRRMLAMRDEAWASVVRPEVRGRDDRRARRLHFVAAPQVLGKFAAMHPRVEIRVIGQPSALVHADGTTVDSRALTGSGVTGELIRLEPLVLVGRQRNVGRAAAAGGLFTHGGTARDHAVRRTEPAEDPVPDVVRAEPPRPALHRWRPGRGRAVAPAAFPIISCSCRKATGYRRSAKWKSCLRAARPPRAAILRL